MFVYVWGINANAKILGQFFHIYLKPNFFRSNKLDKFFLIFKMNIVFIKNLNVYQNKLLFKKPGYEPL